MTVLSSPKTGTLILAAAFLSALSFLLVGDARQQPYLVVGIMMVWGISVVILPKPTMGLRGLILVAALLRALLCFSEPTLSDDIFRYLWEGSVVLDGGNPYVETVQGLAVKDSMAAKVNHPEISSVYPPVAQWIFATLAWLYYDPLSMKILSALADLAVVWVLFLLLPKRKSSLAWLYALHPLPIVESASNGHLEPIAVLCVTVAILAERRGRSAHWWIFLGGGIKLLPWLLFPVLSKWSWQKATLLIVSVVLIALPFFDSDALQGLNIYVAHWSFTSSIYGLLHHLIGSPARLLCMILGGGLCFWVWMRTWSLQRSVLWICGAFVLLSPTVHPWYGLWILPVSLLCGIRAWTWLVTMLPLSYVALATIDPLTGSWNPPLWPSIVIYTPFFLCLLWDTVRQIRYPGPWGSGAAKDL